MSNIDITLSSLNNSIINEISRAIGAENSLNADLNNRFILLSDSQSSLNFKYNNLSSSLNVLQNNSNTVINSIGQLTYYNINNNLTSILGDLYSCSYINNVNNYNLSGKL